MIRSICTFPFLLLLLATFAMTACGSEPPEAAAPADPPAEVNAESASGDAAQADSSFEPAYPEEVSSEGLTAADTEQQENATAGHTHADGTTHDDHGDDAAPTHSHSETEPPKDPPAEKKEGGEGSGG